MTVEGTNYNTILVLDDHFAVASDDFYGRKDFERDYGALPFKFVYSPAWDDGAKQYTVKAALRAVANTKPQGILLDVMFGRNQTDRLGVDILRELTCKHPEIPVVMMTSVARDELWDECERLGAVDYLVKPMSDRLLSQTLNRYVGAEMKHWLIGQNRHFLEAINLAAMAAEGKRTPVMVTGETGTGKELLASFVHRHGRGANTPFKVTYLPGYPPDLLSDALFGHSRGAFAGADRDKPGAFQEADGGVVFLDELGDINMNAQVALLRAADSGHVVRLGDGRESKVDVQIVSATNADLARKMKNGDFRHDLWMRLNGMPVSLPPLAQRREDIPMLVRHLLRCQAVERNLALPVLPLHLEATLMNMLWDGNVRDLLRYAERSFDLARGALPGEQEFIAALPQKAAILPGSNVVAEAAEEMPSVSPDMAHTAHFGGDASPPERLQRLRMGELALLHEALQQTRDRVTGQIYRANAAALIKGKKKCSTNEFDRWVKAIWGDLSPQSRDEARRLYPDLTQLTEKPKE